MHIASLILAVQLAGPAKDSITLRAAPVYHGRQRQTELALPKVTGTVRIDGVLTDSAWQSAATLTGFSQYAPVDGMPAADSTDVLVMYTDYAIYFGIRAFEPHGAVHATHADRDRIGADDNVQLLIDTFNDRRRAYAFTVNPLGQQMDGMFTDQSGTDLNPDFQYESKGRVTEFGYEVEVRIPFKSIRFQQTGSQQWGLNVLRGVQHSGHTQTWTPADRGAPSFLAQSGTLRDLRELKRGLVLDVNPVMTQRTTGAPDTADATNWLYRREDPEFGGNVTWGLTTNLALNATFNPDFSQVEADVGQVVFDPRQAISFPEKRPFFLEGSENFSVPNGLIYTRRIVSPEAAMKLSGKVGALTIGALSAIDDESVVPGSTKNPLYNVLRLRRDLGAQSTLGVVYTDRVHGDNYNRVAGIDTRLLLGSRYVFNGQLATSFTRSAAGQTEWRPLFDFGLTKTGRTSGFNLVLEGVHPDFRTQSGFISRADVAHFNFTPRKTWFPQNSIFESISFSPVFDHTWEWDRFTRGTEPNDMKMNTSTNATLRGGWRATFYTWTETFKYPWYLYTNYYVERVTGPVTDTVPFVGTDRLTNIGAMTSLGTPQWRKFAGGIELVGGQDDNFDEWSSAWILYTTLNAEWRPTDRIRLNGRYIEQRTHRKSDGSLVRLRAIPRVKLEYQIARPLFLRFVGQHDATSIDALRDDSRTEKPILFRQADGTYVQSTPIERGGFRADWLVSYQPNPGTVLFAGYGTSLGSDEFFKPSDLTRTSDGFFLKLSYLFRL
ncbi:MAG TPA: DUF5916 domain-containing protein [Gemmatimonadaceae bacterium]|nr:DUF5916 domain-containing protein [Gemmatimonadaceae bacterium]